MAASYIKGLSSSGTPAVRQGSAAALRVLPFRLLRPCWQAGLRALGQACQVGAEQFSYTLYIPNPLLRLSEMHAFFLYTQSMIALQQRGNDARGTGRVQV